MRKSILFVFLLYFSVWAIDEIELQGQYTPNYFSELLDAEIYNKNIAYILGVGGFIFVDIKQLDSPRFISRYNPSSIYIRFYNGIAKGDLAAGAARLDGIYFISIANITDPTLISIYNGNNEESVSYESVDFSGTVAYAAVHERGLEVIDISSRAKPKSIKFINGLSNAWDVYLDGTLLYVADAGEGIKIFSVEDAGNPVLLGSATTSGAAFEITVKNSMAYVSLGANGFDIIDVSDPKNPQWRANYSVGFGILQHLDVQGTTVFASTWELVVAVDVSDPDNPRIMATEDTQHRAMGIAADSNRVFVTDWFTFNTYIFKDDLQPDIHVKPGVYDFGYQGSGVTIWHKFDVFNLGDADLEISDIQLSHKAFSIQDSQLVIRPGESRPVIVSFTPTYDTYYSDNLTFITNDDDETEYFVQLIGGENGVEAGDEAADFTLTALFEDVKYTLSDFRGQVVVLAIFASW